MTTMAQIVVTTAFKYAHRGHQVVEFVEDDTPIDVPDDCAELAVAEGWATLYREPDMSTLSDVPTGPAPRAEQLQDAPPEEKHIPAAPANKDAAPKRSTKATPA